MATRLLNIALRAALLVALLASTALFVDYQQAAGGAGAFCGATGGCAQVRASAFSSIAGVPLPTLGLGVFLGLFVTAVWASEPRHVRILAIECGAVALGALGLIGIQLFVVKALCVWCMAVDTSALVAAVCAVVLMRRQPPVEPRPLRYLWAGAGVIMLALPLLWPVREVEIPPLVRTLQAPDRVSIITFTDFQCPYCRRLHPALDEVVEHYGDRIKLIRLMRPLERHPGAEPAARAYLCVPEAAQAKFAGQLYALEPQDMTRANITLLARATGVQLTDFTSCYDAPTTTKQLDDVREAFQSAGLGGIPATFVASHYIKGANSVELQQAIERALAGDLGGGGDPKWMLLTAISVIVAAAAVSGALARPRRSRA